MTSVTPGSLSQHVIAYGPIGAISRSQDRVIPEVTLLPACHQHAGSAAAQMRMAVLFLAFYMSPHRPAGCLCGCAPKCALVAATAPGSADVGLLPLSDQLMGDTRARYTNSSKNLVHAPEHCGCPWDWHSPSQ